MRKKKLRTIDLFCGAGGSSSGAHMAGADIVAGFDIWEPAIKTWQTNFVNGRAFSGDLREKDPACIKTQLGEIDLILASPECTNHSVAKGNRDRCDESKRTAFQVTRFAQIFRPKWIIIENVIQMGNWKEQPQLIDELHAMEYQTQLFELDAKHFGVPQSRKRLFIICSSDGKIKEPKATSTEIKSVSSILDFSEKYAYVPLYSPRRAQNTLARAERAITALGSNEPFIIVYYGSDGAGGWQSIDKPLRTITTLDRFAYVKPTSKGHFMRMLQPEELKTAMGFNPEFILPPELSRRDKIKLMGNGVCPPVMQAIVNGLINEK